MGIIRKKTYAYGGEDLRKKTRDIQVFYLSKTNRNCIYAPGAVLVKPVQITKRHFFVASNENQ